jgi:hypothetical protein
METGHAADQAFTRGRIEDAHRLYLSELKGSPTDVYLLQRLGQISLYQNRFAEAEKRLRSALKIDPTNPIAKTLLSQTYYRQDRFAEAIPILRSLKRDADADQLQTLSKNPAYQTPPGFRRTEIPFTQLDPLPVVEVRVNNGAPLRFFIDTGGAELIVDKSRAAELGLAVAENGLGTFAGGKQASLQKTILDSVNLNGLVVSNVPAFTLDLSSIGHILGGRVDGCIGTVFLYHFLATIDYPHKRLILRPRDAKFREAGQTVRIPFWMSGDHLMVAWGHVNSAPEHLFFVDTGLAGAAVNAPKPILDEAGITIDPNSGGTGYGGGGEVQYKTFNVKSLSLGPVTEHDLIGVFLAEDAIRPAFPFSIAGIISHQFFKPRELTFDFRKMQLLLTQP